MNTHITSMPDARVLPGAWKLLLLRLRITYNTFRHAKLRRKIGSIIFWVVILGFGVSLLVLSRFLLGLMRDPKIAQYVGTDVQSFVNAIPVLTLSALFIGTLLTSFGVLLQALYLSGDMDFLLASPIPIRSVFIAKLLQAVLPNFSLIALFGIPILFGLGISSGYNILYYPLLLIVMIALALSAAGLSSLLVMAVVRILPPRRAAEILGFIGAIIGFSCSQAGNFSNTIGKNINVSGIQFTGFLMRANTPWLPLNWAGQGLVALGEGHWLSGLLLVGVTLGLTSFAFWFALVTAERLFYSGWAGMQVVTRKKTTQPRRPTQTEKANPALGLLRFIPTPVLGIVQKDFLTLRRDLRNLSQLVSPIILGVIYTFSILSRGGSSASEISDASSWATESLQVALSYSSVGMSLFVGWMILSRLAGMAFSHEGKNYWMLKVSPVRMGHLLAAKFIVAYLPPLALGLVFLTVISVAQGLNFFEFFYGLIAIIMCLAGSDGILLSFGVLGANFTWNDPRRMNAGGMGCLGQIITMAYMPIAFGSFIVPIGLTGFFDIPILYGYLAGLIIGLVITAACAFIPLILVRKRVERLDEG